MKFKNFLKGKFLKRSAPVPEIFTRPYLRKFCTWNTMQIQRGTFAPGAHCHISQLRDFRTLREETKRTNHYSGYFCKPVQWEHGKWSISHKYILETVDWNQHNVPSLLVLEMDYRSPPAVNLKLCILLNNQGTTTTNVFLKSKFYCQKCCRNKVFGRVFAAFFLFSFSFHLNFIFHFFISSSFSYCNFLFLFFRDLPHFLNFLLFI